MLGFLGLSLFTQARVTLDLFAQRMYIEPPAPLVAAMEANAPGLFDGLADDKYVTPQSKQPMPFGGPQHPSAEQAAPPPSQESGAGTAGQDSPSPESGEA
jgi:hypothetical protein